MQEYFSCYPQVKVFTERVIAAAHMTGYVTTLSGRRRLLPHITESNRPERMSYAQRQSINTVIQGGCSDVLKEALIAIQNKIVVSGKIPKCRIVLQLHDEIVLQLPKAYLASAVKLIKETMESARPRNCSVRIHWSSRLSTRISLPSCHCQGMHASHVPCPPLSLPVPIDSISRPYPVGNTLGFHGGLRNG